MKSGFQPTRDHGGGLDAAMARFGGARDDWLDLSTGINPLPYPQTDVLAHDWTALPDRDALAQLLDAARQFWNVPDAAEIVAAPGASAIIVQIPKLCHAGSFHVPEPTYNEHKAAFDMFGGTSNPASGTQVLVHPNNPDGHLWSASEVSDPRRTTTVVDESFCDVRPDKSHIALTENGRTIVLKSFGKFWGLAGLRLGFAIGTPEALTSKSSHPVHLREMIGPWAVSGPALRIGTRALNDLDWANRTRTTLRGFAARLDTLLSRQGATPLGGTDLFRLFDVPSAVEFHDRLAHGRVLSRIFPYSKTWVRLGLPHPSRWNQLEQALRT